MVNKVLCELCEYSQGCLGEGASNTIHVTLYLHPNFEQELQLFIAINGYYVTEGHKFITRNSYLKP